MASTVSLGSRTPLSSTALCCFMRTARGTSSSFVQPPGKKEAKNTALSAWLQATDTVASITCRMNKELLPCLLLTCSQCFTVKQLVTSALHFGTYQSDLELMKFDLKKLIYWLREVFQHTASNQCALLQIRIPSVQMLTLSSPTLLSPIQHFFQGFSFQFDKGDESVHYLSCLTCRPQRLGDNLLECYQILFVGAQTTGYDQLPSQTKRNKHCQWPDAIQAVKFLQAEDMMSEKPERPIMAIAG